MSAVSLPAFAITQAWYIKLKLKSYFSFVSFNLEAVCFYLPRLTHGTCDLMCVCSIG